MTVQKHIDTFDIMGCWFNRPEKLEPIIEKTLNFLLQLKDIDEQFLTWYQGAMSRKKALEKRIQIDYNNLEKLFMSYIKKGDIDEEGYNKHGYYAGGWSGHKDSESSGWDVRAGVFASYKTDKGKTSYFSNNCMISIPYQKKVQERLLQIKKLKELIRLIVKVWQPEYAVVQSSQLRDILSSGNKLGWMTYYNNDIKIPTLSSVFNVEQIDNFGKLIYAPSEKQFSVENEEQVQLLIQLKEELMNVLNIIK